jgi:hypothetical protein
MHVYLCCQAICLGFALWGIPALILYLYFQNKVSHNSRVNSLGSIMLAHSEAVKDTFSDCTSPFYQILIRF